MSDMNETGKIMVEQVDAVDKPPKARVDTCHRYDGP